MFDKYLIVENSLRATGTGFAFDARLGYYRGLGLSMIEDLAVTLDGEAQPRESVFFEQNGKSWSLAAMEEAYDDRWEFGSVATIRVDRAGGLTSGEHRLGLKEKLRISYLPFPLFAEDIKVITIAA
ncbi:C-glycoside deglycosidase beta subunit domain-containing protein [Sphingobium sp. CAP-1]|uniref:C-glycoside deglycosidase beta subunit domain-containing protein n=1 Tax=Sphingobium sp. CAP-1 TaxID=2676077 RepID=UPI0012BB33F4|nr:DUF6379 domain-containing protein [Sphingobium sp. CAP-1]QGP81180.1 hypothetical protein GL174_19255 [Sphingobium sp. CAP-1]